MTSKTPTPTPLANAVRDALTTAGVATGTITFCAYDPTDPVLVYGPNGTAAEAEQIARTVRAAGLSAYLVNNGQEVLITRRPAGR